MVCPRCISAVKSLCEDLELKVEHVELGKVKFATEPTPMELSKLDEGLEVLGFERSVSAQNDLVTQLKSLVVQQIHHTKEPLMVNFSAYLSEQTHHEYTYLSKLFSKEEGETLEQFIVKQKIEKVKELLSYDEMSLSEIAFQVNYSSAAYLSSQFKKVSGQTPSAFKKSEEKKRLSIDQL